jgi:hypothetical protein
MGESTSDIKANINNTRTKISETVSELTDGASGTLAGAQERLSDATLKIRSSVTDVAQAASENVAALQQRVADSQPLNAGGERNPLIALAAGAIVGVVAGALIPISSIEKERLHPVGDELVRRGLDARDEVLAQSKAVVTETISAAKDSLKQHGRETAEHLGVADEFAELPE